jgi:S1-C subfamily serine protease
MSRRSMFARLPCHRLLALLLPSLALTCLTLTLLLTLLLSGGRPAEAKGSITRVESEFEKAISKVTPATCVCLPWDIDAKRIIGGSSGVIMSRKGLVLSDGDVGVHLDKPRGTKGAKHVWAEEVEVRLPNLKGKGFQSYKARVIRRDRAMDSSLLRIVKPPSGLKFVTAGNSDDLRVGDFTFAVGNSFGLAAEAPPTLTAGVVASLTPGKNKKASRYESIYTSAAVNQGVNGGPLVDIHGHLVGTISSAVGLKGKDSTGKPMLPSDPQFAYAYLGKVVPVERLRNFYADLPEAAELFPEGKKPDPKGGESAALSTVFHHTARRAYRSVVSLEIKRSKQLSLAEPGKGGMVNVRRYLGPVSGVLISRDGYVLTSLYNLANLTALVIPGLGPRLPKNARVQAGIESISSILVHLPDGRAVEGSVCARHEGLGIALIKAKVQDGTAEAAAGTGTGLEVAVPAPSSALKPGRFVLSVGNPFGAARLDDPLLTIGVLSKEHATDGPHPWARQWQTDAGLTDANAGGAAVDLRGRLLGITTIWSVTQHGRNSGIGFIVPWPLIEPVLGELKRGRDFRSPFFGIQWRVVSGKPSTQLDVIVKGHAAEKAGLLVGDVITKVDGKPTKTPGDVRTALAGKWSGDALVLTIRRADAEMEIAITLGARE